MTEEPRSEYRIAIVGGGVIGLFTAVHLARAGAGPIAIFEKGFLSSGSSGRNGGGVRQQWEETATVRLAREAVSAWRRFATEYGYNPFFRQGGYLFLASGPAENSQLERVYSTCRSEQLPVEQLSREAVAGRWPMLDAGSVTSATFLSSDGTVYPFPAIWALVETARKLGVEVWTRTPVTEILREGGKVTGLVAGGRRVRATQIVNAAGGWSAEVTAMGGLASANVPTRHEIFATEPMKPFLDPMLIRLRDGLYVSQTMRGELVGGLSVPHPPGLSPGLPTSIHFLRSMARALLDLFPSLGGLKVLRAWSGYYDDTPDGMPVVGEDPRLRGFFHANGLGGHGFMLAPAVSRRVAKSVLGEPSDLDPAVFGPGRFLGENHGSTQERLQPG